MCGRVCLEHVHKHTNKKQFEDGMNQEKKILFSLLCDMFRAVKMDYRGLLVIFGMGESKIPFIVREFS